MTSVVWTKIAMEVNGENSLVLHILQNIFYVPQKKESHSVLKRHEGELIMTILHFGWTIPKTKTCLTFKNQTVFVHIL